VHILPNKKKENKNDKNINLVENKIVNEKINKNSTIELNNNNNDNNDDDIVFFSTTSTTTIDAWTCELCKNENNNIENNNIENNNIEKNIEKTNVNEFRTFKDEHAYKQHKISKHGFFVDLKPYWKNNLQNVDKNIENNIIENKKNFECNVENKVQVKNIFENNEKFECEICGFFFNNIDDLKKHLETNSFQPINNLLLTIFNHRYNNNNNIDNNSNNSNSISIDIDNNSSAVVVVNNFEKNKKNNNEAISVLTCENCKKKFVDFRALKQHQNFCFLKNIIA
jgi:hypothetical protein